MKLLKKELKAEKENLNKNSYHGGLKLKGYLINLEGIDGSGKNTCFEIIKKLFENKNIEVKRYHYPDENSIWGKTILMYLDGKINLSTEEQFFAYFVDMLKDQKEIETDLNFGKIVVLDRYVPSTIAFQCAKGFDCNAAVNIINNMNIIIPDITIFLDVDPEISIKRKKLQKKMLDKHESDLALQRSVRNQYRNLYKSNMFSKKWVLINSNKDIEEIQVEIANVIEMLQKDELATFLNKDCKPKKCFKSYIESCEPAYCTFRLVDECKEYKSPLNTKLP